MLHHRVPQEGPEDLPQQSGDPVQGESGEEMPILEVDVGEFGGHGVQPTAAAEHPTASSRQTADECDAEWWARQEELEPEVQTRPAKAPRKKPAAAAH